MEIDKYRSKSFLLPILLLSLFSIVLVSITISYISIKMYKEHVDVHIESIKKEYEEKNKKMVYNDVMFVQKEIKFEMSKVEEKLKTILIERIQIALNIADFIYKTHKTIKNDEEIKKKIAEMLMNMNFDDNRGYYFVYDNKTKINLGHPIKNFIGKDIREIKDSNGRDLIEEDEKILSKNKIAFKKVFFVKSDEQENLHPKINCISKFEPLDIIIGIGEYSDFVEKQTQNHVLEMFTKNVFSDNNKYITILKVDNLEGGDDFATVLVNSNREDLVGTKVSDKSTDFKGNRFRKDFLNIAQEKGEGFSQYWYKNPRTNNPALKMSYVYFIKDWKWIIISGFYYEDMEKQIKELENSLIHHTNNIIYKALKWSISLALFIILIASLVSFKIDSTIKKYADTIKDFEKKKRKQENIMQQQSKMAAMGEMIANIAHQWRQPLSTISTAATGAKIQKEFNSLNDEDIIKIFDVINNSAQYLSKTIDDFRSFFNPNNNKISKFKISETFEKTLNILSAQFISKDIELIQKIEDVELFSIENSLIQVLINILNNSRDALTNLEKQKRLIFINTYLVNEYLEIEIKDNGKGISEKIIGRIFEPYFTTKHQSQGTGIGLYMSEEITRVHLSGSISVSNESYLYEGINYMGAKFVLKIPLKLKLTNVMAKKINN